MILTLPEGTPPRLDKALAQVVPVAANLSRSRLQALILAGAVTGNGVVVRDLKAKTAAGQVWTIAVPEVSDTELLPEDIPLDVCFEDPHLIVINKPVGMVVHPAPGSPSGTLVNALMHHCGDSLSGISGEKRPGIVHRIDKDTTGLLVVAKSDAAHHGLAEQFADHSVERRYLALCWGAPNRADPRLKGQSGVTFEPGVIRISGNIARHKHDRKRMAVTKDAGRHAITRAKVLETFGPETRPVASLIRCQLETGRTHQIRVHLTAIGHSLIGDQTYGNVRAIAKNALPDAVAAALKTFPRQALHAETLGFIHPVTKESLSFQAPLPPDINNLLTSLRDTKA